MQYLNPRKERADDLGKAEIVFAGSSKGRQRNNDDKGRSPSCKPKLLPAVELFLSAKDFATAYLSLSLVFSVLLSRPPQRKTSFLFCFLLPPTLSLFSLAFSFLPRWLLSTAVSLGSDFSPWVSFAHPLLQCPSPLRL